MKDPKKPYAKPVLLMHPNLKEITTGQGRVSDIKT